MQDKVGYEYDGMISGLTDWGMYVEIDPTKIEGMVALRDIAGDYYEFDEKNYRIIGKRSRRVFVLGDRVRIKVTRANLEQRLLDFELIQLEEHNTKAAGASGRQPEGRKSGGKKSGRKSS